MQYPDQYGHTQYGAAFSPASTGTGNVDGGDFQIGTGRSLNNGVLPTYIAEPVQSHSPDDFNIHTVQTRAPPVKPLSASDGNDTHTGCCYLSYPRCVMVFHLLTTVPGLLLIIIGIAIAASHGATNLSTLGTFWSGIIVFIVGCILFSIGLVVALCQCGWQGHCCCCC